MRILRICIIELCIATKSAVSRGLSAVTIGLHGLEIYLERPMIVNMLVKLLEIKLLKL